MKWFLKSFALVWVAFFLAVPAQAARTVYDPWNHIENISILGQNVKQVAEMVNMVQQQIQLVNNAIMQAQMIGQNIASVLDQKTKLLTMLNELNKLKELYSNAENMIKGLKDKFDLSNFDSWEDFIKAEQSAMEMNSTSREATFKNATETLESIKEQQKVIQKLTNDLDGAVGTNQLLQTMGRQLSVMSEQNAQALAMQAQNTRQEMQERELKEKKAQAAAEVAKKELEEQEKKMKEEIKNLGDPNGASAQKIDSVRKALMEKAKEAGQKLAPAVKNLLLSFATIALVIIGVRMMLEKNQGDNVLFADALKLMLLLGLGLALLDNHASIYSVLLESADYLSGLIGMPLDSPVVSAFKIFWKPVSEAWNNFEWSSMVMHGVAESVSNANGLFEKAKAIFSAPLTIASNILGVVVGVVVIFLLAVANAIVAVAATVVLVFVDVVFALVLTMGIITIPFIVLPKLDKVFWSWVDSAVYMVTLKLLIAGVLGILVSNGVDLSGQSSWSAVEQFVVMLIISTISLTLIKMCFNIASLFTGTRGLQGDAIQAGGHGAGALGGSLAAPIKALARR